MSEETIDALPEPPTVDSTSPVGLPKPPTKGRIVFFTEDGQQLVAIITAVNSDGTVNLSVFPPHGDAPSGRTFVKYGEGELTWAWPKIS